MQTKRTTFRSRWLPYALIAPQIAITLIFFIWPAGQAIRQGFFREDPFGLSSRFVGLANYVKLFHSEQYLHTLWVTLVFSVCTAALSLGLALLLAAAADRVTRGNRFYTTLTIWPYAIAPAVAGVLFWFMFNPSIGILTYVFRQLGYDWNDRLNPVDAMILVVVAASWKQISYNFLFFLAGLHAIPQSLREAAAIDGAGPVKRFFTVVLPLLSPTTFFLLVVNINYTMFETFGTIDATTAGGPDQATTTLVYKVYQDGFVGLDLGSSSAQSVILMILVMALTFVQFRWIERRVQY